MPDIIRDSAFGQVVRLLTKNRVFQYPEEKDPSLWKRYLDREQTRNMAIYGHPILTPEEQKEKDSQAQTPAEPASDVHTPLDESVDTLAKEKTQPIEGGHIMHSTLTNQRVDTEHGRDASMVSWYGDDDPEVGIPFPNTSTSASPASSSMSRSYPKCSR